MNPKVSIIVPIYNAEKYLNRCIDSILNQEYEDFELLLMDDGSKDSSARICDSYKTDSRVRVIHKENSGVSDTRNLALSEAKGEYIQFLDSDDWITPDATKLFVEQAEKNGCDLVIADFYRVVGDRVAQKGDIDTTEPMTPAEFAEGMMGNPADFYYGVLWNKLFKREIIEKYKIRMNPDISWCEDFMFNLEYIAHCSKICALQSPIYYYVKRKGSLVSQGMSITKTVEMKSTVFEYYQKFFKDVFTDDEYDKGRIQIYRFLIDSAGDGMVAPVIMPSSFKLGKERITVSPEIESGNGVFAELFRSKKLFEQKLESCALKYKLSVHEADVLYCVSKNSTLSRKNLQDLIGISRTAVYSAILKLMSLDMIEVEDTDFKLEDGSKKRSTLWTVLPAAKPLLDDFQLAEKEYNKEV